MWVFFFVFFLCFEFLVCWLTPLSRLFLPRQPKVKLLLLSLAGLLFRLEAVMDSVDPTFWTIGMEKLLKGECGWVCAVSTRVPKPGCVIQTR